MDQLKRKVESYADKYVDQLEPELVPSFEKGVDVLSKEILESIQGKIEHTFGLAQTERGIISSALDFVENGLEKLNPFEALRKVIPKIIEKVEVIIKQQHQGLAILLSKTCTREIKDFLHEETSFVDIAKDFAKDVMASLSGKNRDESHQRGAFNVFSKTVDGHLDTIKERFRAKVRQELFKIEANMWEAFPATLQEPLELVFGGNPFQEGSSDLRNPFMEMQQKFSASLRELVEQGHSKLENTCVEEAKDILKRKSTPFINSEG